VCESVCKTCSGTATTCDSCPNSPSLRDLPSCDCKTHLYEHPTSGICEECDDACAECEISSDNCIECPEPTKMDLPECGCKKGYYMDDNGSC